jgi:hypothetical protein
MRAGACAPEGGNDLEGGHDLGGQRSPGRAAAMAKGGGIRRNRDLEQSYVEETTRSGSPPFDQQAETVAGVQHGLIWRDIEHSRRGEARAARSPWGRMVHIGRRGTSEQSTDDEIGKKKSDRNLQHGSCDVRNPNRALIPCYTNSNLYYLGAKRPQYIVHLTWSTRIITLDKYGLLET